MESQPRDHADSERKARPEEKPGRSSRRSSSRPSTFWPTTPSATARFTPASGHRLPSSSAATASKTSAALFAAFRSTSFPWPPGRSTRSRSTKPIWPADESRCLPLLFLRGIGRVISAGFRSIFRVVHEILHPQVDRQQVVPPDTYWAALRKIHRMRKPVFMGSLWLRARFDVEYMGLPLPTAPASLAGELLMEADLDYIGATRRDRIIAEQFRRQHQKRLEWVARWLDRFGWTFDLLARAISPSRFPTWPIAAARPCERSWPRASWTTTISPRSPCRSRASSRSWNMPSDGRQDPRKLPPGLPDPVVNLRTALAPRESKPSGPRRTSSSFRVFLRTTRPRAGESLLICAGIAGSTRGWVKVVLGQGARDPWAVVKARMRDVLLRTDLWSDQILVLRAVQTLTMLDLQHNCELVWSLGGYAHPSKDGVDARRRTSAIRGTGRAKKQSSSDESQ